MDNLERGFRLGEWWVEPSLNEISNARHRVSLEPQSMEVLCLLARHAGEVVSADEIVRIAWAGRPISDNPIYKTINKLRRALGDNPRKPTHVATVTKRGYRLIAPVTPFVDDLNQASPTPAPQPVPQGETRPESQAEPETPTSPPPVAKPRPTWWIAAAAISIVTAMAILWISSDTPALAPAAVTQFVTLPGSSSDATIAPDGSVIFVNDSSGVANLWWLPAGETIPLQLTADTAPSNAPNWSPDGRYVLFNHRGDVWRSEPPTEAQVLIRNAGHGSYSQDATRVVFERGAEVWVADADGQQQARIGAIGEREQFFAPRRPVFSPDGLNLAYFEARDGPMGDIWTVDLAAGAHTQLTFDQTTAGHPIYSMDGRWIIFHSERNGALNLWRVPSQGGEPELLMASAGDDSLPARAPDGKSIIYTSSRPRWSLVVTDPQSGDTRVLYDSRLGIIAPELSPDGSRVAFFVNNANKGVNVFIQDLATRTVTQLTTEHGTSNIMPKWSVDGDWIYYYQAGPHPSWRRISVEGGASVTLLDGWRFNLQHDITVRPGDEEAIYARLNVDDVMSTQIKNLDSGEELTFPYKVSWVDWSRDGNSLVATDFSTRPLPVGAVKLCVEQPLTDWSCDTIADRGQHPVWGNEPDDIYYAIPVDKTRIEVWKHDRQSRLNELIIELSPAAANITPFFDVTSDGRIVWVRHEEGRAELWRLSR